MSVVFGFKVSAPMKNKNKSPIASFQLSPVRKTIFGLWLNGEREEERRKRKNGRG
jgi:hypothetical protein